MLSKLINSELMSDWEQSLRNKKSYIANWITILVFTIFMLGCAVVAPSIEQVKFDGMIETNLNNLNSWAIENAVILSYVVFACFLLPYLFLAGTWIAHINDVHKSKYFHLLIWVTNVILIIFALVSLTLTIYGLVAF